MAYFRQRPPTQGTFNRPQMQPGQPGPGGVPGAPQRRPPAQGGGGFAEMFRQQQQGGAGAPGAPAAGGANASGSAATTNQGGAPQSASSEGPRQGGQAGGAGAPQGQAGGSASANAGAVPGGFQQATPGNTITPGGGAQTDAYRGGGASGGFSAALQAPNAGQSVLTAQQPGQGGPQGQQAPQWSPFGPAPSAGAPQANGGQSVTPAGGGFAGPQGDRSFQSGGSKLQDTNTTMGGQDTRDQRAAGDRLLQSLGGGNGQSI